MRYIQSIVYVPKREMNSHDVAHTAVSENKDILCIDINLTETLSEYKEYVLIAGIGGKMGRELLQACIDYLEEMGKSYTVIAIEPFAFEGKAAQKNASAFKGRYKNRSRIILYNNNELLKKCGGMLLDNTFSYANSEIYKRWKDN